MASDYRKPRPDVSTRAGSRSTALHRATQKNLPITVAAAGLPQIPRLTGEARSYAERLFSFQACFPSCWM